MKPSRNVLAEIARSKHEKVKVAITDIDGILRGKYLQKDKFLSAAESGFGFCNVVFGWDSSDVCYDNGKFTGWHTGYPDALARIDPSTYRTVPWDGGIPFFLGDFDLDVCPRTLLKRVLGRARKAGFTAKCGAEFEWFNFKETPQTLAAKNYADPQPLTPGMFGYSLLRAGLNQPYFAALLDQLPAFGVPLEALHTETGPGVTEAAIAYSEALEMADRAVLFKTAVKEIAYRHGIVASFMSKWNAKLPGSGGHLHLSLWDAAGKKNVFHDPRDPWKMSATFKSALAGQLRCLPEILPFFAPNVNSYKRLVDGYWSPTKPTWGIDNRTVAFRVIPGGEKSIRVEVRIGGADINPYLAIAASVASALYGVEKGLKLTDQPIKGSAYQESSIPRLPRTLAEATSRLSDSKIARELFGDAFVDHFVRTRQWEWSQFADAVTNWELQRYFDEINNLPRDVAYNGKILRDCFCRAFGLLTPDAANPGRQMVNTAKFETLAKAWLSAMDSARLDDIPGYEEIALKLKSPAARTSATTQPSPAGGIKGQPQPGPGVQPGQGGFPGPGVQPGQGGFPGPAVQPGQGGNPGPGIPPGPGGKGQP